MYSITAHKCTQSPLQLKHNFNITPEVSSLTTCNMTTVWWGETWDQSSKWLRESSICNRRTCQLVAWRINWLHNKLLLSVYLFRCTVLQIFWTYRIGKYIFNFIFFILIIFIFNQISRWGNNMDREVILNSGRLRNFFFTFMLIILIYVSDLFNKNNQGIYRREYFPLLFGVIISII